MAHEICVESYKTDLFIHDTNTVIEIKSILSFDPSAAFPTVYSERAVEQLKKLSHLLDAGYSVCYLFVSLNPRVKSLSLNKSVPDYYSLFRECIDKGMTVRAFSVRMEEHGPQIYKRVDLIIE